MLNIHYGRASVDSSSYMYNQIAESLKRIEAGDSAAKQVLLVVPAQFTLGAEEDALKTIGTDGFFQLQIVSENKLRLDLLKETGGGHRTAVNSLGRSMLLKKIVRGKAEQLQSFKTVACEDEFISMMGSLIADFKEYDIDTAALSAMQNSIEGDSILSGKLADIAEIYGAYEDTLAGKYIDTEDLSRVVSEKVKESKRIRESEVWFYGFYSFTRQELRFLSEIAKHAVSLDLVLCMGGKDDPDAEIFEITRNMCRQLYAEEKDVRFVQIKAERYGYAKPALFDHIEKNLYAEKPELWTDKTPQLKLVRCGNVFSQAKTIASEILKLVREKNYVFSDIAVLTEDLSGQGLVIRRVFDSLGIPVFTDEKRSLLYNPAAQLLCALLGICSRGMTASDVISLLKTGFVFADSDIFAFENYVKRYHITGDRFSQPFKYGKQEYPEEEYAALEKLRSDICSLVLPFAEQMKLAETVREKCTVLYGFLTDALDLPGQLKKRSEELLLLGFVDASEECLQVFSSFIGLTEQMVELIGEEKPDMEEFENTIVGSLSDIKIGILPQSEGRVLLGSVKRTKLDDIKAVFIAGLNDGVLPSADEPASLLTDQEIDTLSGIGYTLRKSAEILHREESLLIYRAFAAPSEYLWLGYSLSDAASNEIKPSPLIAQIRAFIPELAEDADIDNSDNVNDFPEGPGLAFERVSASLRSAVAGETEISDQEKHVINVLNQSGDRLSYVKQGLFYSNSKKNLSENTALPLFEKQGAVQSYSPSRLENFASCPFRHFVNHGLRPEQKRDFEISPREIGDVCHECLMILCERLSEPAKLGGYPISDKRSLWMTVSAAETEKMIDEIISAMEQSSLDGLMQSGKAEMYSASRIRSLCKRFAAEMILQVRKGRIRSMRFETPFGIGRTLPPFDIETKNCTVHIEGKIDRLDTLDIDGADYLKIIDYKSGSKSFDRKEIEKGLSLQLMVYLEGALGADKGAKPAGVFYYNIKDPRISAELASIEADSVSEDIANKLSGGFVLDGVAVGEDQVLYAIDSGFEQGVSTVLGTKKNKQGEYDAKKILSPDDFQQFRSDFKKALIAVCEDLTSGKISPEPAVLGRDITACSYCDFSSICGYDKQFES